MELLILPNMCRICLKSGCSKLLSLYQSDDDEETPRLMLAKLTGITLEDEPERSANLPKHICKNCLCELNLSFQFFEKALQAQSHIERFLAIKENQAKEKIESEIVSAKVKQSNNTTLLNSIEETVEFLDDDFHDESPEETIDTRINDSKNLNTDNSSSTKTNETKKRKRLRTICNEENFSKDLKEKTAKPQSPESFKKLSKRGRKPKATTSKVNAICHVCEICGNVFTKRGRLTEHLRRHETEAKYNCELVNFLDGVKRIYPWQGTGIPGRDELCEERFILREALRRHMFTHLGGKPFKCDFCSRTFFYESVKKAHEAIHAGHKPYVCDKCDKAFAYPHALKKHQLIHDDIKLYSCKYCQKDFRLQHHMKQHEETKAHMNAVHAANISNKK